jgi:glycosyltransferase involved in cell wall biosynthesis
MLLILCAVIVAALYFLLQLYYLYHWKNIPVSMPPENFVPATPITIVIIAHNEAENITSCLNSILYQSYPAELMEIIVVDDRSTDKTAALVRELKSPLIQLLMLDDYPEFIHVPAFKKSGIELAVEKSKHDWIVMTDADCTHGSHWLESIAHAKETSNASFLAGPVLLEGNNSLLSNMQQMEFLALMVITGGGIQSGLHGIANGANMSFSKQAFHLVNGYEGNYQYASGDDMFLIEKLQEVFPGKTGFVKNKAAIAFTDTKSDWKSLISQRARWAGKISGLRKRTISFIWIFIVMYHIALLIAFILAFLNVTEWWPFLILLGVKWISDLLLLRESASFFGQQIKTLQFIPQQLLYSFYLGYVGLFLTLRKKGDW